MGDVAYRSEKNILNPEEKWWKFVEGNREKKNIPTFLLGIVVDGKGKGKRKRGKNTHIKTFLLGTVEDCLDIN